MHAIYNSQNATAAATASVTTAPQPASGRRAAAEGGDPNSWAYTCSVDASALCGAGINGGYANQTTCRSAPLGAHLHLYYTASDPSSLAAKNTFHAGASAALGLSQTICADTTGHEQPHNTTCWLAGPGGVESEYPQDHAGSSFTASTHSLYIIEAGKCDDNSVPPTTHPPHPVPPSEHGRGFF